MMQTIESFIWFVVNYDYFNGHSFWLSWRIFHAMEKAER